MGKRGWPAAVSAGVQGGGSVGWECGVVMVLGGLNCRVELVTVSICADPALLVSMDEDNGDGAGILVSGAFAGFRASPVFGRGVTILEVVG